MALIQCPECGKKVSDLATACPECGYPILKYVEEEKKKAELLSEKEEENKRAEEKRIAKEEKSIAKEKKREGRKHLSKKAKIIAAGIITVLIAALIFVFFFVFKMPYDSALPQYIGAKSEYESVVAEYEEKEKEFELANTELDEVIDKANTTINSERTPLEEEYLTYTVECVSNARIEKKELPNRPISFESHDKSFGVFSVNSMIEETLKLATDTDSINKGLLDIEIPDYSKITEELELAVTNLENSYLKYEQVTNPPESFVIERLSVVPGVLLIEAVTEDNDPNGNLNKAGGYTATVYFTYDKVEKNLSYKGETAVDKGNDGGGAVEVYLNVDDAEKRNTYLGTFDGSVVKAGSHKVCGTCIVRTSDYLTASQQKELTDNIINALTEIK